MKKNYAKILIVLFACMILLSACGVGGGQNISTDTPNTQNISEPTGTDLTGTDSTGTETTEVVNNGQGDGLDVIPDSDFSSVYDSDLKGAVVTYLGSARKVRFPDTINGDPVVGINATSQPTGIEEVSIPNSVKVLHPAAFMNCTGLTSITLPDGLTAIGEAAFFGCTGLTSITIPGSVTDIDTTNSPFDGCTGLTDIKVSDSNTTYADVDGVLFDKAKTKLIFFPRGKNGTYNIPTSVTSMVQDAVNNCTKLTDISVPNGVADINFSGCTGLVGVTIPDSAISLNLAGCTSLVSIKIPDKVTYLNFEGCTALTSVDIPKGIKEIGSSAFKGCTGLTKVTLPDSLTSIQAAAFAGCTSLTSIKVPYSVKRLDDDAFAGCALDEDSFDRIFYINPNTLKARQAVGR